MMTTSPMTVALVNTDNNGGCGAACACKCHTDIPIPGPHIATCLFADPDYTPPDFAASVRRAGGHK